MAWFRNGRKYWKHRGKIYSCSCRSRKYTYRKLKNKIRYYRNSKKYYVNPKILNYAEREMYKLKKEQDLWKF